MKKLTATLLLSIAAMAAISSSAMAADLMMPMKPAPVVAAPSGTWDGPYVGASIGYGWGTADAVDISESGSISGFLAGGQVGYNFHLSDNLVAGIEGNIDWNNESGTLDNFGYRINWDAGVAARLGVDMNGILPYVEAGVAFANATWDGNPQSHTGWMVGVGAEFMLADNLSANVDLRYNDYGSADYFSIANNTVHLTDTALRVGLNYHF